MACSMDVPLLEDRSTAPVAVDGAGIGMPPRYSTATYFGLHVRGRPRMRDDTVAIARMHRLVLVSVEYDRWHDRSGPLDSQGASRRSRGLSLPHGGESRGDVPGSSAGEAGMHADCRI